MPVDSPCIQWKHPYSLGSYQALVLATVVSAGVVVGLLTAYGGWLYACALVTAAFVLRWPVQIALGALFFLIPFDNVSVLGTQATGATLNRYAAGFAVLVLLVIGLTANRLSTPPRSFLWWTVFVFWGTTTIGWALDAPAAIGKLPTAFSLLFLAFACSSFRIRKSELSIVILLTVLGGCVAAMLASAEFFSGTLFRGTTRASLMIRGQETDPNQFAASLILPFSLALATLFSGTSWLLRIVATAAATLLGLAIFLSMSRGGLMAMCLVIGIYIYRLRLDKRILIPILCLGLSLLVLPQSFYERLTLSDRGAGRFDIWIASLSLIPRYGLFGAGWNNFTLIYSDVAGNAPKFHGFTEGAHNIYICTLMETGIAGLAALLLACRAQLRQARHLSLVPYTAACWGMLMMGATLDIVWRKSFWLCWILLAMVTEAARREELA